MAISYFNLAFAPYPPYPANWSADFQQSIYQEGSPVTVYNTFEEFIAAGHADFDAPSTRWWTDPTDPLNVLSFSSDVIRRIQGEGALLLPGYSRLTPAPLDLGNNTYWSNDGPATVSPASAEGSFPTPTRIISGGATWHRRSVNTLYSFAATAGDSVAVRVLYRAGTSGRCRIVMRDNNIAIEAAMAGPAGAIVPSGVDLGNFGSVQNIDHGGGLYEFRAIFTVAVSAPTIRMGIGPDSAVSGQDVIILATQVTNSTYYGPDLVTNGSFASSSNWTLSSGWTISGGQLHGDTVTAFSNASQSIPALTGGRMYAVEYTITALTGSFRAVFSGGTAFSGRTRTATGTFKEGMPANAGNNLLLMMNVANPTESSTDNVSVREVFAYYEWIFGDVAQNQPAAADELTVNTPDGETYDLHVLYDNDDEEVIASGLTVPYEIDPGADLARPVVKRVWLEVA